MTQAVTFTTTLCGETVSFLPERALFWHEQATLFVADLHLGKPDVFLRAGLPIPPRLTFDDLDRLTTVLRATQARRLIVLGDFFHAVGSRSPAVLAGLDAWRTALPAIEMALITGNHDLHAGPPPAALGFAQFDALRVGPFWCVHAPPGLPAYPPYDLDDPQPGGRSAHPAEGNGYVLCGHLHPYAHLSSPRGAGVRESMRLPCFHVGARQLVLPAFGRFTGGSSVRAQAGDRIFVIAGDRVMESTLQGRSRAR